jgi:hypothetical protein
VPDEQIGVNFLEVTLLTSSEGKFANCVAQAPMRLIGAADLRGAEPRLVNREIFRAGSTSLPRAGAEHALGRLPAGQDFAARARKVDQRPSLAVVHRIRGGVVNRPVGRLWDAPFTSGGLVPERICGQTIKREG